MIKQLRSILVLTCRAKSGAPGHGARALRCVLKQPCCGVFALKTERLELEFRTQRRSCVLAS